jgi:anti-sigma regulatory factor (Ser/Thr protein kinase)/anti-anti-sigma regulatory factor
MVLLTKLAAKTLNTLAPPLTRVLLPHNFDRKSMHVLFDQALDADLNPVSKRIVFDFSRLRFLDPTAITVFSNLIEYLRKNGVKVEFAHHHLPKECNRYLDDSGFFKTYVGEYGFPNAKLRETTLALQRVPHDRSHSWINNTFSPWIAARVGLSEASFGSIAVCLSEIFNNIIDHSGENVGCVFAQHYPERKEVMLSVSDFGRGIPTNVRKVLPEISDSAAIAQSVVEGFTTKSNDRNQGAGLAILTKYVVYKNQGCVLVHSLRGSFQCIYSASGERHLPKDERFSYPGTLIQITFRTDYLEPVAVKEEFEW